jgi:hypothetical protein
MDTISITFCNIKVIYIACVRVHKRRLINEQQVVHCAHIGLQRARFWTEEHLLFPKAGRNRMTHRQALAATVAKIIQRTVQLCLASC